MLLVVGLGNPGRQYAGTRHNLGFLVVDELSRRLGCQFASEKFSALVAEMAGPRGKVLMLKPETFMNLSGQAVAGAAKFYQVCLADLLVICDDFNLPLGQLRVRRGGSHGGHNGLRNIVASLGQEEFPRLRLGTGPLGGQDAVSFCLNKFRPEEKAAVEEMIARAADAAEVWLSSGTAETMNRFNAKRADSRPSDDSDPGQGPEK